MPRALLIHYRPAEGFELAEKLRREGFEAETCQHVGPKGFRGIRENPPDLIVIDLRSMPSYGRAMGALLRESKSLRMIPVVFLEGDPAKSPLLRELLPGAVIAPWPRIGAAMRRVLEAPPSEPAQPVPPPQKPVHKKMRIAEGSMVAMLHAPAGMAAKLNVRCQRKTAGVKVVLLFVKSAAALGKELPPLAASIRTGQILWICWPKKASGAGSDLTLPRIVETCYQYRLAVSKVISLDETWSAMAFSLRRTNRE